MTPTNAELEKLVGRLNTFTTCGCCDEDWPLLRFDTVRRIDTLAAEVVRLREAAMSETTLDIHP